MVANTETIPKTDETTPVVGFPTPVQMLYRYYDDKWPQRCYWDGSRWHQGPKQKPEHQAMKNDLREPLTPQGAGGDCETKDS